MPETPNPRLPAQTPSPRLPCSRKYPLSFLGNDLSSTLLIVSMFHVAFNAAETNCLEQVKDVDVLEQEDKGVSPKSRLSSIDMTYH
ncbi:hypothetical protein L195_g012025 [Trifolium pratense]|uniref:Uncharacterized protein n=1 Tax=Trifolium pratense TaxID=57577 RepID=A0A2K3PJ64_TRIPR|nr:hypothetical protein L195_g012025 [Trifolium pratense]